MRRVGRAARRIAWPALFVGVLVVVVMLGIIPTRTYLQKRDDVASAEARLAQLNDSNDKAQRHADALRSDAEIEKIAREQYGLVKPGEEAYHVLPPPQDPVEVPDVWPFNRFHKTLGK